MIDGLRADDSFQPGSSVYVPNMTAYNLCIDANTGKMIFESDNSPHAAPDYVQVSYNFGQVGNGEPAAGTQAIFNITHRSPMESADTYKHITARRHLAGAGNLDAAFSVHDADGNTFRQHLYAAYGQRLLTRENQCGLITDEPFYNAPYYKVQADGYFPIAPRNAIKPFRPQLGYRINFSGRDDAGSEYLYNFNEVYTHRNYSGSLFFRQTKLNYDSAYFFLGLSWASDIVHHTDLQFSKNILDQDGESFFPYVADGGYHSLRLQADYQYRILPWLQFTLNTYNQMLYFSPEQNDFINSVYMQSPVADQPTPLYTYQWHSQAFAAGLMENEVGLDANHQLTPWLGMKASLHFTLDGILLRQRSVVTPNVSALFGLDIHPIKWFDMQIILAHDRLTYNSEQVRFLSLDYMNATIVAPNGNILATSGGESHQLASHLWQPSYVRLDIPIEFTFKSKRGRHTISLLQSYRKYYHTWHTFFAEGIDANGEFTEQDGLQVYYMNGGPKQYIVDYAPECGDGFIKGSPYYFSQLTRYTFEAKRFMLALSWQSMQAAGFSALGNGVNSNSIGVLSETTANPNTSNVVTNQGSHYPGVGRHNPDKGYVCRLYLAYNICKFLEAGITVKWTDGKPFTDYRYFTSDGQIAILPNTSRGTNPTDNDFGRRHCAKYNIDVHLRGRWNAGSIPMSLTLECYNAWDFCTDLAEMSFIQDIPYANRASMIMDIPIGLLATFCIDLSNIDRTR